MNYIAISSTAPVSEYLTKHLIRALSSNKPVTWLVPGGSAIAVAIEVSNNLSTAGIDLSNLSVTLTDERYGEPGNPNENYSQLLDQGFNVPGAKFHRVLKSGSSREEVTLAFAETLSHLLNESSYSIGLFGVGADGHTAGLKPHMVNMATDNFAASFTGSDFERITLTPRAIKMLDKAVIYAVGDEKQPALSSLYYEEVSSSEQPAQVLKSVRDCTLFTDVNISYDKEEQL